MVHATNRQDLLLKNLKYTCYSQQMKEICVALF